MRDIFTGREEVFVHLLCDFFGDAEFEPFGILGEPLLVECFVWVGVEAVNEPVFDDVDVRCPSSHKRCWCHRETRGHCRTRGQTRQISDRGVFGELNQGSVGQRTIGEEGIATLDCDAKG